MVAFGKIMLMALASRAELGGETKLGPAKRVRNRFANGSVWCRAIVASGMICVVYSARRLLNEGFWLHIKSV